jgi:hypothetical protein
MTHGRLNDRSDGGNWGKVDDVCSLVRAIAHVDLLATDYILGRLPGPRVPSLGRKLAVDEPNPVHTPQIEGRSRQVAKVSALRVTARVFRDARGNFFDSAHSHKLEIAEPEIADRMAGHPGYQAGGAPTGAST